MDENVICLKLGQCGGEEVWWCFFFFFFFKTFLGQSGQDQGGEKKEVCDNLM